MFGSCGGKPFLEMVRGLNRLSAETSTHIRVLFTIAVLTKPGFKGPGTILP